MHRTALLLALASAACVIDEVREDEVGEAPGCSAAQTWPNDWGGREDALLEAVNDARAMGGMCRGAMANPVPDLELAPALRCAARLHAVDQAYEGTLDHVGNDGSTTLSRIDRAQYLGVPTFELLAGDFLDPQAVVDAWASSDAECDALYDASAQEFGPGFARSVEGDRVAWVLLVGERRE